MTIALKTGLGLLLIAGTGVYLGCVFLLGLVLWDCWVAWWQA